jgi:probable rRNA maturation factor
MSATAKRGFSITRLSKDAVPCVPFARLKSDILGDAYDLSLVFVTDAKSKALNIAYRGKDYIPNVLSFPLTPAAGEIFINLKQARREHAERGQTLRDFVALLFVHGCLHLKGMRHGRTMEDEETRALVRRVKGYRV